MTGLTRNIVGSYDGRLSTDTEDKARSVDAQLATARGLPTTRRVAAKQRLTVAEDRRRYDAGCMQFVDTPNRLPQLIPMIARDASGCRIVDLDGNELIDLHVGTWTGILGHSPRVVVDAIRREAEHGLNLGTCVGHELEIQHCELLTKHVSSAEIACHAVSGTSAVMHAFKVARAKTGRSLVAKFSNAFHGHDNDVVVDLPDFAAGLPRTSSTLVLPPTAEAFDLLRKHASDIAAVIVEPAPPVRDPRPFYELGMFKQLRALTAELGIVLIFDEVLRGFRSRFGATLDEDGVVPDVTLFGKIIGGGLPLAAIVGKREVMDVSRTTGNPIRDRGRRVGLVGTYAGNRLACAAGIAQLEHLRDHPEIYTYTRDQSRWLAAQIDAHASKHKLPIETLALVGGMVMVRSAGGGHGSGPMDPVVLLQTYLRDQGVYFMGAPIFVCAAHTPEDLARVSAAFDAAMAMLVADGAA